jgi:hypothetical protein
VEACLTILLSILLPIRAYAGPPVLDGDLSEWTDAPRWTLTKANQVAGRQKVTGDTDLSARIWLEFTADGLFVAGDVRDDRVILAAHANDITGDHPEIWLSLPAPALPPMGFANQFGDVAVLSAAACDGAEGSDLVGVDRDACKAWFAEQGPWRSALLRMFTHQYMLVPTVAEVWASQGRAGVPTHEIGRASSSVLIPVDGGYRFEALIGLADFPATVGAQITEARVMIDLVDSDRDGPQDNGPNQESFLSTSARRRMGDPTTFDRLTFTPIEIPTTAVAASVLAGNLSSAVRFPGVPDIAWDLQNVPVGYQYTPTEPSPSAVRYDLRPRLLARHGGVDVVLAPVGGGVNSFTEAWTLRGGAIVAHAPFNHSRIARVGVSGDVLRLIFRDEGMYSALGTGACGACRVDDVGVLDVRSDGRIQMSELAFVYESTFDLGDGLRSAVAQFEVSADLRQLGWVGTIEGDRPRAFAQRWAVQADGTWDDTIDIAP